MNAGLKLHGLGPKRLAALRREGITDLFSLLDCLPRSYLFAQESQKIADALPGEACIEGTVQTQPSIQYYGGRSIIRMKVADNSGTMRVFWFNQPWMVKQLNKGERVVLHGLVQDKDKTGKSLLNPKIITNKGIIPQYKPLPGLPGKVFANLIDQALQLVDEQAAEAFPNDYLQQNDLIGKKTAWIYAHRPQNKDQIHKAQRRIGFENLLMYQLAIRSVGAIQEKGPRLDGSVFEPNAFWESLPFAPTSAQALVLNQIHQDMSGSPQAMRRLIQGDVGSGKTAVAFGAAMFAIKSGYQCALMAPTELLARQHLRTAAGILSRFGIRCGLLLGGMKAAERRDALQHIRDGTWQFVIGTHALISKTVAYHHLGLVITDEQHRFGVKQRQRLADKADSFVPHILALSATPIPRSLALVLYGDLNVSIIDELPPGRQEVKTRIVPQEKRASLYDYIKRKAKAGEQSYLVCPLVQDSDAGESDKQSATTLYNQLRNGALRDVPMALTYGSQPEEEKQDALERFYQNKAAVLVSTTVIEVGMDVPNATTMVIEDADMFGLAQLHQLRGRVGRGSQESWCFLLGESNERLQTLVLTNDGFEIAQKDLELRGPGEFLGTRQHGKVMNVYGISNMKLVEETSHVVKQLVEDNANERLLAQLSRIAKRKYAQQFNDTGIH
ncbi:MAG: ATP-dependent DNA helicase RecG [Clostridiales bacterium]|nr:ATP-dependent DNA helicase RecG [Clostridiales bacterium]